MTEHAHNISCIEVWRYICRHHGEDENSKECQAVKQHIAECPHCSAYCDSMEKMIGLFRSNSPTFPEQAKKNLVDLLHEALISTKDKQSDETGNSTTT